MKRNILDIFFNKILDVPLWIKQVLFIKLLKEMNSIHCEEFLRKNADNIFSTYVPTLTFKGNTELTEKKCGLDNNIYNFLNCCSQNYSIIEISANTFLSMEEVAKYFEFCIEQNFIEKPLDSEIEAMSGFISGKYRIGEYFKHRNSITQEQLNLAISEDEKSKKEGKTENFGEILVEQKFIKPEHLKSLLILKEEAKKRFVLDYSSLPQTKTTFTDENQKYQTEIKNLKEENKKLKQKMLQLLELVKNN